MIVFAQNNHAEKYAPLVNADGLKKHLTIIASDEMEGRETGTAGQRKAAAYIESEFKKIGLKQVVGLNGYQQFYPLNQDTLVNAVLNIDNKEAVYGTDFITPLNLNVTNSFKSNEIVFVGYGIDDPNYSDYANLDVKGKVVLFFTGEPKKEGKYFINADGRASKWNSPSLVKKIEAAALKGAVGIIIVNPSQEIFSQAAIENSKRNNISFPRGKESVLKINYAIISHALAQKIAGNQFVDLLQLAKNNQLFNSPLAPFKNTIELNYSKYSNIINASNVVGIVEGSDKKDEYVFLTAHYDHLGTHDGKIYNGADDDGSGTVTVIQMASAFAKAKKDGNGPRRTIVFMTVSGEEKGLWGSEYYSEHPFYPTEKTSVDLNTDMIGRVDTERKTADTLNYVYVVGHDKISSELPIINEGINNNTTKLVLDYRFDDPNDPNRIYYRSDHYNFARKGIPVLFFYDGMLKSDYHKPTDDVEKINWPLFEKRAQMIFYTAWEMANRENMLMRDKPLPTGTR